MMSLSAAACRVGLKPLRRCGVSVLQPKHRQLHMVSSAPIPIAPPTSLEEFDVDFSSPIGEGATGVVYPAQHKSTNIDLIIKVSSVDMLAGDKGVRRSELSEGIAHEKSVFDQMMNLGISHPHVVDMVGYFDGPSAQALEQGLPAEAIDLAENVAECPMNYFIMERLQGESLRDQIERSGGLEECEAKPIVKAICEGLDFLHRQGVVHRDVKPDNILYSYSGTSSAEGLKLIDFSHAGVVDPRDIDIEEQEWFEKRLGTPGYIAPEVLLQDGPYNAKCDVFSLGCSVHAMLSNMHLPRRHPSVGMMTRLPNNVSMECRDLLDSLLSPNPEDRPTVSEVLQSPWLSE